MKTLVALSALVAIAIAAPGLPEHRYVGHSPMTYRITPTFRREKKSATEANHGAAHLSEAQHFPRVETNHMAELSGRTFGLKKPIIVKNKSGYQLYRDSDEEQAHVDSQEKCAKEVNVKLCDVENPEARSIDLKDNSACETDLHHSKSDIEQSIKTAKQAVEKLQHTKHDWDHSNSGPDAELHKDIEIARQALEHILQNFGNLETTNMQAANAEALQEANLHIAKGKRIAQWMEAINNIQKNAEIARNLEDGFTASNTQVHMINKKKSSNELENAHNHEITVKSTSNDEQSHMDKLEEKTEHIATHQDMKAAASEMEATFDHKNTLIAPVGMPVPAIEDISSVTSFAAKSDFLDKNIHSENGKAKSSELDLHLKHPVAIEHRTLSEPKEPRDMKSAEVINMEMAETKQSENAKKALELAIDTLQKSSMKSNDLHDESAFPAQAKNWQAHQMPSAKNAAREQNVNDLHNTDMQRVVTFGLPTSHHNTMPMHHHYNLPHYPSAHHRFDYPSHDFHHSFHGNGMHIKAAHAEAQEKSAEMDNTAQGQMNTNNLSGKSALEHNTHWKQEQMATARGAYGPYGLAGSGVGVIGASAGSLAGGSSDGSGAIGVFPHATGKQAIPLFLSCSPSVVSGSLAKAQPGYGASAYRAGENMNLHSKRDTKNNEKNPATKAKWTRTNG